MVRIKLSRRPQGYKALVNLGKLHDQFCAIMKGRVSTFIRQTVFRNESKFAVKMD